MFDSILVANRGEIACRIIATARRLGIRTVAVHSAADSDSRHVEMADAAYPIGPAPARESYLSAARILDAARRSNAQAIHPGYGFLSENAGFAEACAEAGMAFIGPPPSAIRAMGSKSAAKALMEASGVPLVPGYHGAGQELAVLQEAAGAIGYPVLIKASAGGGGKGMRIVENAGDFASALRLAQGEAQSAFGDDRVLVERYLTHPRHIEIQVFGDSYGNMVSLFERDCSIQRRHQKVIEEAPAPGLSPERRRVMGEVGCAAARAVGYVGAGTVEFIVDAGGDGAFYFMEMNTRLQVEHPVTEMITGQDLVEWQLRVAAGEPLPLKQEQLSITGHAIEARLYAEDPERGFLPSTGTIRHFGIPAEGPHVRVDTGVRSGDVISPYYDPMIAKLIVWDSDRPSAVRRLAAALGECEIAGIRSNAGFLRAIATHPAFAAAELETGFIARHADALARPAGPTPRAVLAAAVQAVLAERPPAAAGDPHSPWNSASAWRLNGGGHRTVHLQDGDARLAVRAATQPDGVVRLDLPGGPAEIGPRRASDTAAALWLDGVKTALHVIRQGAGITVTVGGWNYDLLVFDPLAAPGGVAEAAGSLTAPMPARVVSVGAEAGQAVRRGAVLMVLEAMKMQLQVTCPADGIVKTVHFRVDDQVEEGVTLVSFETAGTDRRIKEGD
jgi:3-methylcrotonyl-CoA carboxylase alpha subunit